LHHYLNHILILLLYCILLIYWVHHLTILIVNVEGVLKIYLNVGLIWNILLIFCLYSYIFSYKITEINVPTFHK